MTRRDTRSRLLAAAALCALTQLGRAPAAQDPAGPPTARDAPSPLSGTAFLPLEHGATWHYRVIGPDGGDPATKTHTVTGSTTLADGTRVFQVEVQSGNLRRFRYLSATADGIFQHANRHIAGLPGLAPNGRRTRLVAAPLGLEPRWAWTEMQTRQTAAGAARADPADEIAVTASLAALGEKVTVPAGTFDTAHIETVRRSRAAGTRALHDWYARGVGLVKHAETAGGVEIRIVELTRFVPGEPPPDPNVILARHMASHRLSPDEHDPTRVEWVPLGLDELLVQSRFAKVTRGGESVFWRVFGAEAVPFAVQDKDAYTALIRDEGLLGNADDDAAAQGALLPGLAARLCAASLGWRVADSTRQVDYVASMGRPGGGRSVQIGVSLIAQDGAGEDREIIGRSTIEGDRITSIGVEH